MQWIKTLIMFLALFLGSGALSAKPQTPFIAKHEATQISSAISSLLSWTSAIPKTALAIHTNNQQIVINKNTLPKTDKKVKYRCGSKRFKNFSLTRAYTPLDIKAQRTITLNHKHTRYCCRRYCCGKKSWRQRAFETKALLTSSSDKTYPEHLPDDVLKDRHRALCIISPRE